METCTTINIYKIDIKNLVYCTGNSTQYSVITYMGNESKRVDICLCTTDSLCCTVESGTHCKSTILQ